MKYYYTCYSLTTNCDLPLHTVLLPILGENQGRDNLEGCAIDVSLSIQSANSITYGLLLTNLLRIRMETEKLTPLRSDQ